MAELRNGQWELNGVVFGEGTNIPAQPVSIGSADISTKDAIRPRVDGSLAGRDTFAGRSMTFDLGVIGTRRDDDLEALENAWRNDATRQTPGAVTALRYMRRNRVRTVFGRPRRFAVDVGGRKAQFYRATAQFDLMDSMYYSDKENSNTVTIVPPQSGGLIAPLKAPLTTVRRSSSPGSIFVDGSLPAWLRIVIHGPIIRPKVDIVGKWAIEFKDLDLKYDEWVEINPTPGGGYIRKNGAINLGGALTPDSPYLSKMIVPPGNQEIVLRGTDQTGTSYMQVFWRDTYASF